MSLFAITFELKQPQRNYQPFWDALHLLGAEQATESVLDAQKLEQRCTTLRFSSRVDGCQGSVARH